MLQLPGKHIAFVFSDPAGANACIGFARLGETFEGRSSLLFCNKRYDMQDIENLQVVSKVPDFKALGIDCVFAGTSHPESSGYFELNCIRQAQQAGIKTISFVDHWVNFRLRFLDENKELVLPDEIWVLDEKARQLAIEEGLPEYKLLVNQNPYHKYLEYLWKPSFKDKAYLDELNIPKEGLHILFIPDPLSLRNGKEIYGFTEIDVLNDLIEVLPHARIPIYLIVKAHPLQPIISIGKTTQNENVFFLKEVDSRELILACNLVVGIFSNLIVEAFILKKPVVRYFPFYGTNDLFLSSLPILKFDSKKVLKKFLQQYANTVALH
jgi:hypothetical protein